jgi:hypothetical protein
MAGGEAQRVPDFFLTHHCTDGRGVRRQRPFLICLLTNLYCPSLLMLCCGCGRCLGMSAQAAAALAGPILRSRLAPLTRCPLKNRWTPDDTLSYSVNRGSAYACSSTFRTADSAFLRPQPIRTAIRARFLRRFGSRCTKRSNQPPALLSREPVADSNPQPASSLYAPDSSGQVRTQEPAIRSLVGRATHRRQPHIDRRRSVLPCSWEIRYRITVSC